MTIKILTENNTFLLDKIAEDVFDNPINPQSLRAFIECPRHIMALAVVNDEIVGMASAVEYFHPDKPPQLWINEIGVSPKMQNRKIGRQLLRKLLDIGKERGAVFAWLGTATDNFPGATMFQFRKAFGTTGVISTL